MSLQATIRVPGIVRLAYPYADQAITSFVRLSGNVIVPPSDQLPAGEQYLLDQLSPSDQLLVMPSHALRGKHYIIETITYYMDGVAVRQVDYSSDEVRTYAFGSGDYLGIFYGNQIAEGPHIFTIVVQATADDNPGVTILDSFDLPFFFSTDTSSIKPMLDAITPAPFLAAVDHQIIMFMLDYIFTQRTEGAIKNDIDFLGSLYDIDKVPAQFLPYLAKTVGYDYFAGFLGNGDAIREELRYLPTWQKSAGTKEGILLLLRILNIEGTITPLYLDLQRNILTPGVKQRYAYTDTQKVKALSRQSRLVIPLTHDNFVPTTLNCVMTVGETVVAAFVWDILLKQAVWHTFLTTSPSWLVDGNGTQATLDNITAVLADGSRGGVTVSFDQALKLTQDLTITTSYLYEVDARPGRNTRLSEFFDITLRSTETPNALTVKDWLHAIDVVKRSKPFRTKIRNVQVPASMADAMVINSESVSSNDDLENPDRLIAHNIDPTTTNLKGVTDSVAMTPIGNFSDGFLFSWELDCNLFENRFGMFYSMALEPDFMSDEQVEILARDTLVQRGYAAIVNDDSNQDPEWRKRYLRPIGSNLLNFTTPPACKVATDHVGHYYTLKDVTPVSPAIQSRGSLLIQLEQVSPSPYVGFFIDILRTDGTREGTMLAWDWGSGLSSTALETGVDVVVSWDLDTSTHKQYTASAGTGSPSPTTFTLDVWFIADQDDVEAFWTFCPNLRNVTLELGQWAAVFTITGDFYNDPVHISTILPTALLNHQGTCCGCDIAVLDTTTPATFSQVLGITYQFAYEFDLEVYSLATEEVFAAYRWSSGAWRTLLANADLAVTLSPANAGHLTDSLTVAGTVAYTGPVVAGIAQQWGVRACAKRVGERLSLDLSAQFTDDFGAAHVHRGELGVIDETQTFGGVPWLDLLDMSHDMGDQRLAAFDGFYLRGGVLLSCFTYTITMNTTQFTWDSSTWDGAFSWDNS